jgi:hypothetical protein
MFSLKQESISIDGIEFTVTEPMARDILDMNKGGDEATAMFLISRCVSVGGKTLGDDANAMPARYLNPLSEVIGRLSGQVSGTDSGND